MRIRPLTPADEPAAKKFLRPHIASSMFLLGNLTRTGSVYKDAPYHGEYLASFADDGTINGIIAHFWNGNIMLQALDNAVCKALAQAMRDAVTRPVCGFLGPDAQVLATLTAFDLPDDAFATNEPEGLYTLPLANLIEHPVPDTGIVPASAIPQALLVGWLTAYDIEALCATPARARANAQDRAARMQTEGDAWALLYKNTPVALCGFNATLDDTVQIGPVWTPPEHRRNGYAACLTAGVLNAARKNNIASAVLFTQNPYAARAYESIGFKCTGDYRLAILKTEWRKP